MQIALARDGLRAVQRIAHGRRQEGGQDRNDRDDDQKLDEGKPSLASHCGGQAGSSISVNPVRSSLCRVEEIMFAKSLHWVQQLSTKSFPFAMRMQMIFRDLESLQGAPRADCIDVVNPIDQDRHRSFTGFSFRKGKS